MEVSIKRQRALRCTGRWIVSSAILGLAAACVAAPEARAGDEFINGSFEDGLTGWELHASATGTTPWRVVQPGAASTSAMEIVSSNPYASATLGQSVKLPSTNGYVLSFDCRFPEPIQRRCLTVRAHYADAKKESIAMLYGPGWEIANGMELYLIDEAESGGWTRRSYAVPCPAGAVRVGLTLEIRGGAVRVDNVDLALRSQDRAPEPLLYYNPFVVPLGTGAYERLQMRVRSGSPFLKSADLFHRAMVAQSLAQESLDRLQRTRIYTGQPPASELAARSDAILARLERLYRQYGELFLADRAADLPARFDEPARSLSKEVAALGNAVLLGLVEAGLAARATPSQVTDFEKEAPLKPIEIGKEGKPNQLVFGSHSKPEHFDMEAVLGDIRRVRSIMDLPYAPDPPAGRIVFPGLASVMEPALKQGAEWFNVVLPFQTSDNRLVTPAFFVAHRDDPEIYMQRGYHPKPVSPPARWGTAPFNIFNPAVRESGGEAAAEFAAGLKAYRKIYVGNWEDSGPCVEGRTAGYGAAARAEFQKHLATKYTTIARLNEALRTGYRSFGEIEQPTDKRSILGDSPKRQPIPVCRPLAYEFDRWVQQVYTDYCKLIYRAVKAADPKAIVMSDHNGVFESLGYDPMTVFEYSDWVGNHAYPYLMEIFQSLRRYAPGKQFGVYENQWGMRERPDWGPYRPGEERAWRNYLIKHAGDMAAGGYVFDSWWYSYTRGEFILQYGSAHWAHPAYDLTMFRYFATGIPTGIRMARRFEGVFLGGEPVKSRVALLIPTTALLHQYGSGQCHSEMRGLHQVLQANNIRFEALTEDLLLRGRASLRDVDVCVAPFAAYFPPGLWDLLTPWLRAGGTLVSLGPSGLYTEHGFDDPASLTRPLIKTEFPLDVFNDAARIHRDGWKWENGDPLLEKPEGKGRIVLTTRPVLKLCADDALCERFLRLFEAAGPHPRSPDTLVWLTAWEGKGGRHLFAQNPSADAALRGTIEVPGRWRRVRDLAFAGGFPVPAQYDARAKCTRFPFGLEPGGFTMFALR